MEIRCATRYALLTVGSGATAIEVGVRAGDHALGMLQTLQPRLLFLVDAYLPYVDGDQWIPAEQQEQYYAQAVHALLPHRNTLLLTTDSEKASELFENSSIDFVYLDACHQFYYVLRDIDNWWPKIRAGGVLGGHDFSHADIARAVLGFLKSKPEMSLTVWSDDDWAIVKKEA